MILSTAVYLIRAALTLYALLLLLHFALPYFTRTQQPWMAILARICEPGVLVGNAIAAKLFPQKRFKIEIGTLIAVALCYIVQAVLNIIF